MSEPKILVPTDLSPTSYAAFDIAKSLARERGATILIAHVHEISLGYGGGEMGYGLPVPSDEELLSMLDEAVAKLGDVPHERRILHGRPWQSLVSLAEQEKVQLIVMATHGRTGLLRAVMGSVAEAVVRHAPCPVLTIRQPDSATGRQ